MSATESTADHVAYVFVSGNGESVQALGPPEAVDAIAQVIAERDRLARWKEEAPKVLGQWDLVGDALGWTGDLGESYAVCALTAVTDLIAERDRLRDELGESIADALDLLYIDCAESWITTADTVIHEHCADDGSSDEHNAWVDELANTLWLTLGVTDAAERHLLRDELGTMRARGGDRARMTCPQCPDGIEEMPVMRCIRCGCGYYDEVDR